MDPDEPSADDVRFPRQPYGGAGPAVPPPPAPVYGAPPPGLRPASRPSGLLARLRALLGRR